MALGINYDSAGNSKSFMGFVKFNAKAGRITRRDRDNGENTDVDITRSFKAVMDVENIEHGWMDFDTGGAPSMMLVHNTEVLPAKPSDKHRKGFRIVLKLSKENGGDIRELSSHAASFSRGLDKLHDDYLAGAKNNAGKVPVVVLNEPIPIVTGDGVKKQTNYAPSFEIVGWVKRPDDLQYQPRTASASAPVSLDDEEEIPVKRAPPSTGSTRAAAPVARQVADDEDFG